MISVTSKLFSEIQKTIALINTETITTDRKAILQPLLAFVKNKAENELEIRLNFICTHNSRRSHLSQIWAQTLAAHFNIKNVFCYSGGTESTAVFPTVIQTLKNQGFQIQILAENSNPIYAIKFAENQHPIIAYSKKLDDQFNPESDFAALMTCSQADEGCPFIAGAEKRISLPYEDPKAFDSTPQQAEKYNERSLQIATELYYVFSKINP